MLSQTRPTKPTGRLNQSDSSNNHKTSDLWETQACRVSQDQWDNQVCRDSHDPWDSQACKASHVQWDNQAWASHVQWDSQVWDSQDLWDLQVVSQAVWLPREGPTAPQVVKLDPRDLLPTVEPVTCSVTTPFSNSAERAAHFVEHLDLPGLIE